MKFLSGFAAGQIWLRHVGNHLEASIIGIADKRVVQNWYSGKACQIEQFQTADGKILLNTQVEALVSAMASFAPMALGKTTLPADEQMALATVRDARWWTAED